MEQQQYVVDLRDNGHTKKLHENFYGLVCRKGGIATFLGVKM